MVNPAVAKPITSVAGASVTQDVWRVVPVAGAIQVAAFIIASALASPLPSERPTTSGAPAGPPSTRIRVLWRAGSTSSDGQTPFAKLSAPFLSPTVLPSDADRDSASAPNVSGAPTRSAGLRTMVRCRSEAGTTPRQPNNRVIRARDLR